ncbi:hypothetical protein SLA2020_455620 [Shorea laevis]
MPPRKKASSSSRKSNPANQQSQPSKFGIQHFFERHTQNAVSASQKRSYASNVPVSGDSVSNQGNDNPSSPTTKSIALPPQNPSNGGVAGSKKPKICSVDSKNSPQNTPLENLVAEDGNAELSPEISKSVPLKRFNFSPGMLIKQSQDDGGDEVTWKISPINERLQAVSKQIPEVIKVLADSSRRNSFSIRNCSQNKGVHPCPGAAGKADKPLSLSSPKTSKKSSVAPSRVGLKRVNPYQDNEINGGNLDVNASLASQQSPFRTPPSLSYCHDKFVTGSACGGPSDQLGLRQHKKALLELLDQVEDAISTEDSVSNDLESCSSKVQAENSDEMSVKTDPRVKAVPMNLSEKTVGASSDVYFLVLEVSEKRRPPESSGACALYKVLRLINERSGEEHAVYLWEEWYYSVIAPGDTVNVIGEFDDQGKCDIDHEKNFLIIHPDILISGTRVAASFNCPRRTVLDERLTSSEYATAALTGTLLHEIFQAGLLKEIPSLNFLEEYARLVLQKNLESLYACGVNENDMYKTLIEAIPKILNWIFLFKDSQNSKAPTIDFGSDNGLKRLNISEVIDIEEMAWAPKYGLKGMIDASVRVQVESSGNEAYEKILPLEFKTGKAPNGQSSVEHCAQVILYTLLMSERYLKPIDSGLLYYLQSDHTQGITVRRSDLVGLIMRRNELANDIVNASTTQQLPPMLRVPSMCKGCRHLDVCTIYHKALGGDTETSGLGDMYDSLVHHLSNSHCSFLRHWDRLIDLEAKEMQLAKREIWHSHTVKRDRSSSCFCSIALDELPERKSQDSNRFIYRFVRQRSPDSNVEGSAIDPVTAASSLTKDLGSTLKSGDYVMLSTESGCNPIASGVITEISPIHVSVSFSKRLRLPRSNASSEAEDFFREVWRIDKDENMTSFSVMRFNLVQLFLQNAEGSHLRKMIVDLEAPRFDKECVSSQDPAISYLRSEKSLNDDQRRAILKILAAKDYALILGMPGTGKTTTMVHAVKALLLRGASILLTSYTNSAVDNLLIKLKAQDIDFVRIGRHEAVHEEVRGHCFSAMNIHSVNDIKIRLSQVKVVAVTCLGITSPLLSGKRFDVCIMDEAGQTTLPVSLGPLMFASMFVLVGDHYQLPPLVQSTEARENGMGISLFCRLSEAHPQAISPLQSQYRMCQDIMELSNALIYGDRLCCGSSEIASAQLSLSRLDSCSSWLQTVLNPSKTVIFINTDMLPAFETKDQKTVNNQMEAHIIAEITEALVNNGIEGKDIGIITPYNSQANLIRHVCEASVEIHTIDKYQGRDKDCILVSFVRSSTTSRNCASSLLGDWHRINVALTRAKKKLIMVGSCKTLSKVPLLKLLINKVEEQSGIFRISRTDFNPKMELKRCTEPDSNFPMIGFTSPPLLLLSYRASRDGWKRQFLDMFKDGTDIEKAEWQPMERKE